MMNMSGSHGDSYTAAIVTFRRAGSLATVLEGLRGQSVPPSLTVVADNDPDQSAREVVDAARKQWPGEIVYAPVGENLGPAGGWAHAVEVAASDLRHRGEWVLVIDDDDPIETTGLVESLLTDPALHRAKVAGVGLRGAQWDKRAARLVRVEPAEGDLVPVDYLASGGAPLYSWEAIDDAGFFNPDLFFGFEDLDLGFRLSQAGWDLLVAPRPSLHSVADTAGTRTPWREYYKARALVWILSRHQGPYAVAMTLMRSVILGGLRLGLVGRRPSLFKARLLGAIDGMRGRMGVRRYRPGANPAKPKPPTDPSTLSSAEA